MFQLKINLTQTDTVSNFSFPNPCVMFGVPQARTSHKG